LPAASAVTPMFDATMLHGGKNRTQFAAGITTAGNGPGTGFTFTNIRLVNPWDSGAVPNDATRQWFMFDMANNNGSKTPWLAIKNGAGWLIAGDQRRFETGVDATAVRHIPSSAQQGVATNANQIDFWVNDRPANVSSIVVTGPGVTPSTGVPVYSASQGNIWMPPCGTAWFSNASTNCMDVTAAAMGAQYSFKIYTTEVGSSMPAYTYVNALPRAPLDVAGLAAAAYPVSPIPSVSGSFASGGSVTVSWTLPAGMKSDNVSIGAWQAGTSNPLFQQNASNLSGTATTATITVPTYTGTIGGRNVWLATRDAGGNRVALDLQLTP
jgi:hypothetical protein